MGMVESVSYTIRVTKETKEEKLTRGEWVRVRTDEQMKSLGSAAEAYGYAPDRVQTVSSRDDIFTQTVDDLDMRALIAAVNKMEKP